MELLVIIVWAYLMYKVFIVLIPTRMFTSSSGFWTGFWVYMFSTQRFRRFMIAMAIIVFLVLTLIFLLLLFAFHAGA
jgi:hypothetical protein